MRIARRRVASVDPKLLYEVARETRNRVDVRHASRAVHGPSSLRQRQHVHIQQRIRDLMLSTLLAVSGSSTPPMDFSGAATFCTSTRSSSGISRFAIFSRFGTAAIAKAAK